MKFQPYIRILTKIIVVFTISCKQPTIEPVQPIENKDNETLIRVNKIMLEQDMIRIVEYGKRHQLNLTQTASGLHYQIIKTEKGRKINTGKQVIFSYKVSLLDEKLCYSSDSTGLKQVIVGSGKVENGLDEGLSYLKEGDSAIFLIPPHLAYGFLGDNKCIPPRSCIVYCVKVIKVIN